MNLQIMDIVSKFLMFRGQGRNPYCKSKYGCRFFLGHTNCWCTDSGFSGGNSTVACERRLRERGQVTRVH